LSPVPCFAQILSLCYDKLNVFKRVKTVIKFVDRSDDSTGS